MRGAGNKPTTNIINAGAGRNKVGVEGALWRGDVWSENFKKGHGNVCVWNIPEKSVLRLHGKGSVGMWERQPEGQWDRGGVGRAESGSTWGGELRGERALPGGQVETLF